MSGAFVAVLHDREDVGGDATPDRPDRPDRPVEVRHEWPPGFAGPVWVTITAPDPAPRTVTIHRGSQVKRLVVADDEPRTYSFFERPPAPGEPNLPTTVHVEPGAEVDFGAGPPPVGAIDASAGWEPAPAAGDGSATA